MVLDSSVMRNTHFTAENKDAQYALRFAHPKATIQAMSVGEKIRELRQAKGMTLAEVESRANLTDGNLSRIERGKQWASEEVLNAIADALGVATADLFRGAVSPGLQVVPTRPAVKELVSLLDNAADEVRLLTVYRLASVDDRKEIDSAVADVIERLDIVSILNKRQR